ncbi:MAG: NAD(P)-binding protein, partial [Desulfotomaculales bacterium]
MAQPVGAVMVVGGGIAGIQASLDLAEAGYFVYLVERSPAIGGVMPMLDKTFPTNDCSMCILSPKLVECGRHLNIKVLTLAEVEEVTGEPGNFKVKVRQHPRYVDLTKCTGCGECAEECPVEVEDEFNQGLSYRKAIYRPYAQAYPNAFAIEKRGISPCRGACPAGVNAQGYVQLVRLGKYNEAWELIYRDNPFPAVCGRVCTAPCQSACYRGKLDGSVQIRELKRKVADRVYAEVDDLALPPKAFEQGKKVAVVGAGPCGLSAAYQLVRKGYTVTVFEAAPEPGGMLRYAIPAYRLPKEWVDLEVGLITRLGVELRCNFALGKDFTVDDLFAQGYEAVFLALGAHREVTLGVPGEDLEGVMYGIEFLRKVNQGQRVALGERVAVIGGGNTAMDAARTALRLGAKEVTIVYRRSEYEITALPEEIAQAKEEGITFLMLTSPKAFHGEGRVRKIECLKNELGEPDGSGRRRPVPIPGSEFYLEVDSVIVAIGQVPDTEKTELARNRNGTLQVDPETLATNRKGVFAGGDVVTGPASVVEAVAAGKKAAEAIDRYLRGRKVKPALGTEVAPPRFSPSDVATRPPLQPRHLGAEERTTNFSEVCLGYSDEDAKAEADRCLNCGVCSECGECVRACLREAIEHEMQDTEVELEVGSIILCPGFKTYDAGQLEYYGYGKYKNVLTSLEFERILSASGPYQGHLMR